MTVRSLSTPAKLVIAQAFTQRNRTINELAAFYGKSRRTIIRALEEQGIDPGIKKRGPRKPKEGVLTFPNRPVVGYTAPWYRRVYNKIYNWCT